MKIAQVCFPIERVGGIKTYMNEINLGFKELGHTIDEFFITTNKMKKPKPFKNAFNIENVLGFEKLEWIYQLKETLNNFDFLFFQVPCPHLLKNYTRTTWTKVFDILDTKKIVAVIHDPYLEKYYPWFRPICEKYNIKLISPQTKSYDSSKHVKTENKIIMLPYKEKCIEKTTKENILVDANNFKSVKHKELIFKYMEKFKKYKIYEFGDLKTLEAKLFIQKMNNTPEMNISIEGWKDNTYMFNLFKKALIGTDFSRFGKVSCFMDYTILEYADFFMIPITAFPIDKIFNIKTIDVQDKIDFTDEDIYKNKKALSQLEPKKIAYQIIEYLNKEYEKPKTWW